MVRLRPAFLVIVSLALLVASCGVSRNDAAADSSDATNDGPTTTAEGATGETDPTAPPNSALSAPATTAPDGDVAATVTFADGSSEELLHGPLNEVVVPTQDNPEFVNLVFQGQIPPGFAASVLSQAVVSQVMDSELSKLDAEATPENVEEAKSLLFQQLQQMLVTSSDPEADAQRLYDEVPYLPFITGLQARQIALSSSLSAEGTDPCIRHILVEDEATAQQVLTDLNGGADFAELAAERSIGPTGPAGGDLGCAPADGYVPEFAAAVNDAELGVFLGPIETEFGWHVLVVDRFGTNGDEAAQALLTESLTGSTVTVDERVGTWDPAQLTIVPVGG